MIAWQVFASVVAAILLGLLYQFNQIQRERLKAVRRKDEKLEKMVSEFTSLLRAFVPAQNTTFPVGTLAVLTDAEIREVRESYPRDVDFARAVMRASLGTETFPFHDKKNAS